MKKVIKVLVIMVIICTVLTGTVGATCFSKWAKEAEEYSEKETSGMLVAKCDDGYFVIEFDNETGYFGMIEFSEDGDIVDEEYLEYDQIKEDEGYTYLEIFFLHN